MANPYNMTEFDAAGAIGAMEAARSNRIRSMLLQRQIAREDAELEAQRGIRAALARYTGGGDAGAASQSSQSSQATPMLAGVPELFGQRDTSWAGAAPPSAPAQPMPGGDAGLDPARLQALFNEVVAIDPQQAFQLVSAFSQMDESQARMAQRRIETLARAAYHLLEQVPEEEWSAEFQRMAPDLVRMGGVTRQQLAGFQLSRRNLQRVLVEAQETGKLFDETRPELRNVGLGEDVIDVNAIDPATGQPRVVYRSPFMEVGGDIYRRPEVGAAPPVVSNQQDYDALPPGAEYVDPQGNRRRKGGPTRAGSGGFP